MSAARKYQIVVWGATGFTGKLVCEYLAKHYPSGGISWALGGRSKSKIDAVLDKLEGSFKPDIIIADSSDPASLAELAKQTKVVITTVGPYQKYGHSLVAACVENGTSYVDLTGEATFARAMIDLHHARAKAKGVKIVHCCGFDSIPSDLGTLVAVEHMRRVGGDACARVDGFYGNWKGSASGGTLESILNLFSVPKTELLKMGNPYYLNPCTSGSISETAGPCPKNGVADRVGVWFDSGIKKWTVPFMMAAVNTRVVRRTAALLEESGHGYGPNFAYNECKTCGLVEGLVMVLGVPVFALLALFSPTRALLRTLLAWVGLAPGQGPDREMQRTGFFEAQFVATASSSSSSSSTTPTKTRRVVVCVKGIQDPGYAETAKMISEAALCLALDDGKPSTSGMDSLSSPLASGGVLTPASAMGMALVERLRNKGMTFSVVEDNCDEQYSSGEVKSKRG